MSLESYGRGLPSLCWPWGSHAGRKPGTRQREPTIWPAVFAKKTKPNNNKKTHGGLDLESPTPLTTTAMETKAS